MGTNAGGIGAAASQGLGSYLNIGSAGCTLCQSPITQQFLFLTALVAAMWFWYIVIED
jgi:hypothetical protein